MPVIRPVLILAALSMALLSACGGGSGSGSDTTAPPPSGGGASGVQGIATPSSVSVVTAKNAQ